MNCHSPQNAACGLAESSHLPSRHDNPFATCWTRPGALTFRFDDGQSAAHLVTRLAKQGWRGAIVGPHGSGKSTLLETLKPAIVAAGYGVRSITLRNRQRRLPADCLPAVRPAILIVDGYEQLGWLARRRLQCDCRRANVGLVITSHFATSLPTLIRLAPSRRLVQQLVADLTLHVSATVKAADVVASHACHGSNVREIFFDLYDRHEGLRRVTRLGAAG
jgi:hypothetical protein